MTRTKMIVLAGIAVVLIAAGVAVKMMFFPAIKEVFFQVSPQRLRQVPRGLVVVRPTHFSISPQKGITSVNVRGTRWMVGRDVTFQQLIALAYGWNSSRV